MNFRIVRASINAEKDDTLHEARLLLLLLYVGQRGDGSIDGITKLAKLDFLLRYPTYFQRLLTRIRKRIPEVPMESYEAETVENKMIRFKYGPWDSRYRRWIGTAVARGLADTYLQGRTVHVRLTDSGKEIARVFANQSDFSVLNERCQLVARTAGTLSGTRLKDLVYEVVPELSGMAWGEEIMP